MNDAKKYLIGLAVFAASAFILARLVPGIGQYVGLAGPPLLPKLPFPFTRGSRTSTTSTPTPPNGSTVQDLIDSVLGT